MDLKLCLCIFSYFANTRLFHFFPIDSSEYNHHKTKPTGYHDESTLASTERVELAIAGEVTMGHVCWCEHVVFVGTSALLLILEVESEEYEKYGNKNLLYKIFQKINRSQFS